TWRRRTGRANATLSGRWSSEWKSRVTRSMSCFGSTHIRVITTPKKKVCNFVGGEVSPLLALIALHGIEEAITHVYPEARVIAYPDDCLVLHPDRAVLEQNQQLLNEWLAGIGLTLNTSKTRMSHTLEGDQPGMDFLGFHIRQYRVGKHQSGKGPRGVQRLG